MITSNNLRHKSESSQARSTAPASGAGLVEVLGFESLLSHFYTFYFSVAKMNNADVSLNDKWASRIKSAGCDFVYFVDASVLPNSDGYSCAVIFGKALSKDYMRAIAENTEPKHKEIFNLERKMDSLSVKIAEELEACGYKSVGKLKTGVLPHKTAALRAGLGFIGKNNLLVTEKYGCALMFGKVLTTAPFVTACEDVKEPECKDCNICADVCPTNALLGKTWSITTTRDEILVRKECILCQKCMAMCPYTAEYLRD